MTTDPERIETAKTFLRAFERADGETMRSLAAEDFGYSEIEIPPEDLVKGFGDGSWADVVEVLAEHCYTREGIGVDDLVAGAWTETFRFDGYEFENVSVAPNGRVVLRMTVTIIQEAMIHGLEPTGDEIRFDQVAVVGIDAGEVTDLRVAWEDQAYLEQLGVLPGGSAAFKTQHQFHKVVSRVLRHNLRTDLNVVENYVGMLAADDAGDSEYVERVRETTGGMLSTVEKIRDVEQQVLHADESEDVAIAEWTRTVVDDLRDAYPGAAIDLAVGDVPRRITSNKSLLDTALREAVENAVEHSERDAPLVDVSVHPAADEEYAVTLAVSDDGPGIPDHEISPLFAERETPLEHGSGVGLWAIKWSVEKLGGELDFETDDDGSTVRLTVPDKPLAEVR